jgi:carbonic anhydrase
MKKMNEIVKVRSLSMAGNFNVAALIVFLMAGVVLTSCSPQKSGNTENNSAVKTETITQTSESQSKITPEQAVAMLKEGNERFTSETMINRDLLAQVKQTGSGQYPFAAVVSCVDSRIPTEIVFDQGIGDIFNARIAGNFVNTDIIGSLEFATKVAGSKAIIVMGHTECGAVKGACDHVKLGNLTATLSNILPAVEGVTGITENRTSKNAEFVQKVADLNVELAIEKIKSESVVLNEMFKNGKIAIVGAMYDVHTGKVTFMN